MHAVSWLFTDHTAEEPAAMVDKNRKRKVSCQAVLPDERRGPTRDSFFDHKGPGFTCHSTCVAFFEKTQCAIYAVTYIILHRTFNRNMLPKVPQLDQTCQLSLNQIAFHCSYLLREIYVMMDGILFHDFLQW